MPNASSSSTWHLVTCEFPPRLGGVADFTRLLADVLSSDGPVHVWAPAPAASDDHAVLIHELQSGFTVRSLMELDRMLGACPAPRRLFIQWVPHGYGYKSLNLPFCLWVRRRARGGDDVDVMVHEPFLPFDWRRLRQNVAAAIHRLMLRVLLGGATRVWVSTSSFMDDVRRFSPHAVRATWLPVGSPLKPVGAPEDLRVLRTSLAGNAPIVGHFGTCHALVAPILSDILERIGDARPDVRFILAGRDTDAFAAALAARGRLGSSRIVCSGARSARDLSLLLQCCDVFVQPYHDGVSTRRTTLMALLQHGGAVVSAGGSRTEDVWMTAGALELLPRLDPALFASAALALLDDSGRRRELSARARAAYSRHFDVHGLHAALTNRASAHPRSIPCASSVPTGAAGE